MDSFKQGIQSGEIKRADAMKIRYQDIHVEPGFNLRDVTAPDYETDLQALEDHLGRGGQIPPLEVRPRTEGGVWLVDGHRRHAAIGRRIAKGDPIEFVNIVAFVGNDAARVQRIISSQEGRKLHPLEIAEGYRRLRAMNLTPDDIARRVGKTRQHIDQLLILADAPQAVQNMVKDGTVSATLAMQMVRQHGEKAAHILQEQLGKAVPATTADGSGKPRKITAKQLKPWTPPAKVVTPVLSSVESFLASVPTEARKVIENAADDPDAVVEVSAKEILDVFMAFNGVLDAQVKAAEKQRAKEAQAAQGDLVQESQGA